MDQRNLFITSIGAWAVVLVVGYTAMLVGKGKQPFIALENIAVSVVTEKQIAIKLNDSPMYEVSRLNGIEDYLTRYKLSFEKYCSRERLNDQFACTLTTGNSNAAQKVLSKLVEASITPCTAAGNTNQAWRYALMLNQVKANATAQQINLITTRLTESLEQCLSVLDGIGASLWHGRFSLGAEAFIVASALFNEGELLERSYYHFNQSVMALTMTEGWPGGYNYWIQNRGLTFYLAVQAYISKGSDESYKQHLVELARRNGLWHIYMTRPDGRIQPTGDEGSRTDLKDESQKVIHLLAKITQDPAIATFADFLDEKWGRAAYYPSYYWLIPLVFDPDVEHLSTKNKGLSVFNGWLPNQEIFGKDFFNQIILRTGWSEKDTFVLINGGQQFSHHQHADAGHFTYFTDGQPVTVDGSFYSAIGAEERLHYGLRSSAKNLINIESATTNYQPSSLFEVNIKDGTQNMSMPTGSAVQSVEHWLNTTPKNHYIRSKIRQLKLGEKSIVELDITPAYFNNDNEKKIIRRFEFDQYGSLNVHDEFINIYSTIVEHINVANLQSATCLSASTKNMFKVNLTNISIKTDAATQCNSEFVQLFKQNVEKNIERSQKFGVKKAWYDATFNIAMLPIKSQTGNANVKISFSKAE